MKLKRAILALIAPHKSIARLIYLTNSSFKEAAILYIMKKLEASFDKISQRRMSARAKIRALL